MPTEDGRPIHEDYLKEDVKDGKEGLVIYGNPKMGKSNTLNRLDKDDLIAHDRNIIMPGDVNCEFRNLLYHPDKPVLEFDILIPHDCEFEYAQLPEWVLKHIKKIDYSKDIIIEDFLKKKKRKLLVIYDDHLDDMVYWKRLDIWNDVTKQLIRRTYDLHLPANQRTTILRFDEGGVYFPEIALGEHYKMIYRFNYLNVSLRKSHVQIQLAAQQDSEMKSTIHGKQTWKILKKGAYSKRIPKNVRTSAPFFSRDQMALFYGGIYNKEIYIYKMQEAPVVWKMVPLTDFNNEEMTENKLKEIDQFKKTWIKHNIIPIYAHVKKKKKLTFPTLQKLTGEKARTLNDWFLAYKQTDQFQKDLAEESASIF